MNAALSLAQVAFYSGDRVALLAYDRKLQQRVAPGRGVPQLRVLIEALAQVRAANESVMLAQRELEMARDRFSTGVGDNLEVVTAQTSLANARDAQVTALAQHNASRLNLAAR